MPQHEFIGPAVDHAVTWVSTSLPGVFHVIQALLAACANAVGFIFLKGPEDVLIVAGLVLMLILRGPRGLVATAVGLGLILEMGLWTSTMNTLTLVVTAGVLSLLIGIPLGVAASESESARAVLRPLLDFMQTMPSFVYLIPAIIFFGLGTVPAVISTVIFAVPPALRLTDLGLRQVAEDTVEAGEAFGGTRWQVLGKIKLPLAMPSIMAGVNQTIMLALSMVVIAGMIGAPGLGSDVLRGIDTLNVGLGFTAGLAVVLVAIYLDRVTEALAEGPSWAGRMLMRARTRRRATADQTATPPEGTLQRDAAPRSPVDRPMAG